MSEPVLKLSSSTTLVGHKHPGSMAGRGRHPNRLPDWVLQHPRFRGYRQGHKSTLRVIADACGPPDASGGLVGAFGGRDLIRACGVGRSTFFRHVSRLIADGFVVVLARGHNLGEINTGNVYGIPGTPGAMDGRKCRRRMQRMVVRPDGRYEPRVIEPGTQPGLWPRDKMLQATTTAPCQNGTGGSVNLTRGVVSKRGANHGSENGFYIKNHENHGAPGESKPCASKRGASPAGGSGGGSGGRGWSLTASDLADTGRLLGLFGLAVGRGWIGSSEADRLNFVAAAEHALRVASHPPALFTSTVKKGRWLFVTHAAEQAAARRIREHLHGARRCGGLGVSSGVTGGGHGDTDGGSPGSGDTEKTQGRGPVSADARLVAETLGLVRRHGIKTDPFHVLKDAYPGWTRDRFDRAVSELGVVL